jgi:hypothetical protein
VVRTVGMITVVKEGARQGHHVRLLPSVTMASACFAVARITGSDWADGGLTPDAALGLARAPQHATPWGLLQPPVKVSVLLLPIGTLLQRPASTGWSG